MTNERDLLRDLERSLDVSPSPTFEARVRERVRAQSMGVPRWTWPAGVAVAATLVLAVMLVAGRQSPARPDAGRLQAPAPVPPAARVGGGAQSAPPSVETRKTTMTRRARRTAPRVQPDVTSSVVVVPEGQMAAIQRLMHEVAAGRVVKGPERPEPPAALQISALAEAPPIQFDTIRFTPLSADASPDLWR